MPSVPLKHRGSIASERAYWREEAIVVEMRKRERGLVRVAGWLPRTLHAKMKKAAKRQGTTINEQLELALKAHLR